MAGPYPSPWTAILALSGKGTPVRVGFTEIPPLGNIEVPSSLPTLTFAISADQIVGIATNIDSIVAAIVATIGVSSATWRHLDTYSTGNQRAVLVGGPVGSPVENMRIIFALGNPAPALRFGANSAVTNALYTGMSPDAGAVVGVDNDHFAANGLGPVGNVGDPFAAANPFAAGLGARWSSLGRHTLDLVINGADSFHVIDSAETFMLVMTRTNVNYISYTGATILPPADSAAEADLRVYGLHCGEPDGVRVLINSSSAASFPGDANIATQASALLFDPAVPATTDRIDRTIHTPGNTASRTSSAGAQAALAINIRRRASLNGPQYGWLRQLYIWESALHGAAVTNLLGIGVGITVGRSSTVLNEALCFLNLPPYP